MEKEWFDAIDLLKDMHFIDSEHYLAQATKEGKSLGRRCSRLTS